MSLKGYKTSTNFIKLSLLCNVNMIYATVKYVIYCIYTVFLLLSCRFSIIIQEKDESELRPVFTEEGITYVYIKVSCIFYSLQYSSY